MTRNPAPGSPPLPVRSFRACGPDSEGGSGWGIGRRRVLGLRPEDEVAADTPASTGLPATPGLGVATLARRRDAAIVHQVGADRVEGGLAVDQLVAQRLAVEAVGRD